MATVCNLPNITVGMIQRYKALNAILCISILIKIGGFGPDAEPLVLPKAIAMVPMKNPCAMMIGKTLVDLSAASALAVELHISNKLCLSCFVILDDSL